MNPEEYKIMYDLEDAHWRYAGIRTVYLNLLDECYKKRDELMILDAGCGTGIMLERLKKYGLAVGIDISEDALYFSRLRGHRKILNASIEALPFADESFDLIAALEVIYHLQVKNDGKALEEFRRTLKAGGRIIVCVPAYDFLRSGHDEAVHTRHRYTKRELKAKMEGAGFMVERITYVNALLFPLIALIRLIKKITGRKGGPARSDLKPAPFPINKILTLILTIEAKLLRIMNFPFGLSVLCIAQKRREE